MNCTAVPPHRPDHSTSRQSPFYGAVKIKTMSGKLMEFEDQEEHEEEIGLPTSYDSFGNSTRVKMATSGGEGSPAPRKPRYRECLKNHAVSIGGHAVDGCGEFMAAGAEGTLDALKCAACNCHRNFHRKEMEGERLGWRIQKHDEAVVQQFCSETGVKRHVLKVWMHNNKHTLGLPTRHTLQDALLVPGEPSSS
ncbi:unnamed protein product, partial [Vitis vinifera]